MVVSIAFEYGASQAGPNPDHSIPLLDLPNERSYLYLTIDFEKKSDQDKCQRSGRSSVLMPKLNGGALESDHRSCLLVKFPLLILFKKNIVLILVIFHLRINNIH